MRNLYVQNSCSTSRIGLAEFSKQGLQIVAGSLFLFVMSQIQLHLFVVPFTLQTLAVFLLAGLMGSRKGTQSVALYILWGAFGLPVFSGFKGGLAALVGPTGGYLIGFIFAAYFLGDALERKKAKNFSSIVLLMIFANLIIYLSGITWLARFIGFSLAVKTGIIPFILGDIFKIFIAASIHSGPIKNLKTE